MCAAVILENLNYISAALWLYAVLMLACETHWSPIELIIKYYVNISLHHGYILSYIPHRQCEMQIM